MKNGDNLLLVAFGAGLTWGRIVLKWCNSLADEGLCD